MSLCQYYKKLSISAANLMYVKTVRPRLQTVDISTHKDSTLCIDLNHEQVAVDRRVFAAAHNIYGGNRTFEIAAQVRATHLHGSRSQLHNAACHSTTGIACGPAIRSATIAQIILALMNDQSPANDALCGIKEGDDFINNVDCGSRLSLSCDNVAQVTHMPGDVTGTSMSEVERVEVAPSCHTAIYGSIERINFKPVPPLINMMLYLLSIRAPYLVDVEPMRPRLQSCDVSSNGHWALGTRLGHDKVPADRGVPTAPRDTHGGDRRPELAALVEAFLLRVRRPPEREK